VANFIPVPVERVKEIIEENKAGKYPEKLIEFEPVTPVVNEFHDVIGQDSLTRFEDKFHAKKKKIRKKKR
jgi:hypothetical protein